MKKHLNAKQVRELFYNNAVSMKEDLRRFKDRKYVIGIDQSLNNSGVAIVDVDNPDKYRIMRVSEFCYKHTTRGTKTVYERMHLQKCFLTQIVRMFPSRLIVMEGYAFSMNQNRELLGEVGGLIKRVAWDNPDTAGPLIVVTPMQLKKYILGKVEAATRRSKEKIIMEVFKRYRVESNTNDEADAYVLARIALDVIRFSKCVKNIPNHDKGIRNFMVKNGHEVANMDRAQFEVVTAIVKSSGGEKIYDYFNREDHFGDIPQDHIGSYRKNTNRYTPGRDEEALTKDSEQYDY